LIIGNRAKGIEPEQGAMGKEKKTSTHYGRPETEIAEAWFGKEFRWVEAKFEAANKWLINYVGEEVV
jgi:hypothetical protein